jgi:hypothetical protein
VIDRDVEFAAVGLQLDSSARQGQGTLPH